MATNRTTMQSAGDATRAITGRIAGAALVAVGGGMIVAALLGEIGDHRLVLALAVPGLTSLAVGVAGIKLSGPLPDAASVRPVQGFAAVTIAYLVATAAGAIPFLWAETFSAPLDAVFESMSGFTATGATLINDVDGQPDSILLWRSISQWLGGIGIVVAIVALAPAAGASLQRVFYAETSRASTDRLTPRIADTAKIVAMIYVGLTAAAGLAYGLAGMTPLEALNHSMTTLSTGGFSTRTLSLASFDSLAIELIAIVFMIAGGVNFALYWRTIKGRPIGPQLPELKVYLGLIAAATGTITAAVLIDGDVVGIGNALRQAGFSVASIISTTGFTTADFDLWGSFPRTVLVVLMLVGGCAGSTAGGIKVVRLILLTKTAHQEIQQQIQPKQIRVLRLGGSAFPEGTRLAVLSFFLLYMLVFAIGLIAMTATGLDAASSVSAVATTMGGVGPGLGEIGAIENFEALPNAAQIMAVPLMLAGRLEIFSVVALLVAIFDAARRR